MYKKNNEPKVSVIVPVYNVESFLDKCINSICEQEYKNIEIILVDDGSTDNSGKICDKYIQKDDRINVLHKTNGGVSSARNAGIDAAAGDYICFVDGDDYIMPDYVSYLLRLAETYDSKVAVSTEWFTSFELKQNTDSSEEIYSGERAAEAILCYEIPIGVNNKIFSKDLLGTQLRFIEKLCIGEGFNFNTAVFQRAEKVAVGHRKTYFYRKDNENSVTTKFDPEKWKIGLYALQRIKEDFIIDSEKLKKAWNFAWWRTNTDVYDLIVLSKTINENREMYDSCKSVMRKYAMSCFKAPVASKQRLRAMVMTVCPRLIPWAMIQRRKKYNVQVK